VAASLGMGLAFDFLFFEKLPGISFPIYVVLTLVSVLLVARWRKQKLPKSAYLVIPPLLFLSGMVFVRSSGFVLFLDVVATLYLLGLFVTLIAKPGLRNYLFVDYLQFMVTLPLMMLAKFKEALSVLVARRAFMRKHKALPQVLRGVLIALPVFLLFLLLFTSADLVFRHYVTDLFSFNINDELFARVILVLLAASAFVGLFGALGQKLALAKPVALKKPLGGLIEVMILFGSLNVLFVSFIMVQMTYLFGGVHNVIGGDFTYAEYARKGFFELIAVAGLTLILVFVTERLLLQRSEKHDIRFKLLAGALIAQVMVVMASAFKRLQLYEGAYGFTTARLYSYLFIIWLAIVFGLLLYKIFADRREQMLAFGVFVSILAILVFVNLLNVDRFVAHRNIERSGKLDIRYLGNLSSDAVPETVRLLNSPRQAIREGAAYVLYQKRQALLKDSGPWQSANLSRQAALRILNAKAPLLEKHKDMSPDFWYMHPDLD
jgi:hypothetical protein